MIPKDIDVCFDNYLKNEELSCASLLVRRGNEILYKNKWGVSAPGSGTPLEYNGIFRMMSLTKCVTAVAVMILAERGLLAIDDPVSKYIPVFASQRVCDDKRYEWYDGIGKKLPFLFLTFRKDKVKSKSASRDITIRDLLSHSSGMEQGVAGLLTMMKLKVQYPDLKSWVEHYALQPLDFEPGTGTGYSPVAGYDILGYLVQTVSGMSLEAFIRKEICGPLGMPDTGFFLTKEQESRFAGACKLKKGKLIDVTGTKADVYGILRQKELCFEHGCGGLYSTLEDYDRFGHMLLNGGELDGVRILKPETVGLLHTEAPANHLEPEPGFVWGLGMKIRQAPEKAKDCFASEGTYGWSGAFGTHFFISPEDELEVVFMTNKVDLNGSESYVSRKIEELVFGIWGKRNETV